jgi:uncharacterized protein (TIGR03437 family)
MCSQSVFFSGLLCLFANFAFGQTSVPTIAAVQNFVGQTNFSPGAYAFAYATNLGTEPTVTVNQAQAQVFSITPSYVSFQIPLTTSLGTGSVVIQNSAGSSTPFMVPINATSPAIVLNDAAPPISYFFEIVPQFVAVPTPIAGQRLYIYVDGLGASVPPPNPRVLVDGNDITVYGVTTFLADIGATAAGSLTAVSIQIPSLPSGPHMLTVIAGGVTSPQIVFTLISDGLITSQTGLSFAAVQNGPQPPAQSFSVLSEQGNLNFSLAATTFSGGNWLSASPLTGTSNFGAAGTPIQVQANPAGLAAGTYYGQITVSAPDAPNSPQAVTIVLTVASPNTNLTPSLDKTGLIFVGAPNGTNPAAQTITLFNPTSASIAFTATSSQLFTTISSGTLSAGQSLPVSIQASTSAPAGIYSGTLTFSFANGSSRVADLFLILAPGASPSGSEKPRDSGCTPSKLVPVFSLLGDNFTVPAAWPTPIAAAIDDDCGTPVTAGTVVVSFSNGDPLLNLTSNNDGTWSATWPPGNPRASGITLTLTAVQQETNLTGTAQITGGVTPNASVPIVAAGGVVETASYSSPAAPGNIVAIFGANLASSSDGATSVPLPNTLATSSAIFAGQEIPLFYASGSQINAVLPYGIMPNTRYQLVVQSAGNVSVPQNVLIGVARPAVFTIDASGKGQGQIYWYDSKGDQILAGPNTPATNGDVLVIYCSGLGEVSPSLTVGTATPLEFLTKTVGTVTVTIGGAQAQVTFAGLTPGSVGLYQINVAIPSGLSNNSAMPLQVFVDGQNSPVVTFAFHN